MIVRIKEIQNSCFNPFAKNTASGGIRIAMITNKSVFVLFVAMTNN